MLRIRQRRIGPVGALPSRAPPRDDQADSLQESGDRTWRGPANVWLLATQYVTELPSSPRGMFGAQRNDGVDHRHCELMGRDGRRMGSIRQGGRTARTEALEPSV